jgi:hypothetical protein
VNVARTTPSVSNGAMVNVAPPRRRRATPMIFADSFESGTIDPRSE